MTHDEKYKNFTKMLIEMKGKAEEVMIHDPQTLGGSYEELVENLNRLSDSGLVLRILPRAQRTEPETTHDTVTETTRH
jgi:hypothetical protein